MSYSLVGIAQQARPICNCCDHIPRMDQIKLVVIHPRRFDIIKDEFHVWRHPGTLDWRNINSTYVYVGICIAHYSCQLIYYPLLPPRRSSLSIGQRPVPVPISRTLLSRPLVQGLYYVIYRSNSPHFFGFDGGKEQPMPHWTKLSPRMIHHIFDVLLFFINWDVVSRI
jgi:hypothetical protein